MSGSVVFFLGEFRKNWIELCGLARIELYKQNITKQNRTTPPPTPQKNPQNTHSSQGNYTSNLLVNTEEHIQYAMLYCSISREKQILVRLHNVNPTCGCNFCLGSRIIEAAEFQE